MNPGNLDEESQTGTAKSPSPLRPAAFSGTQVSKGSSDFLEKFYLFIFLINVFIYLFLAALGLRCCTRASSSCGERGLSVILSGAQAAVREEPAFL